MKSDKTGNKKKSPAVDDSQSINLNDSHNTIKTTSNTEDTSDQPSNSLHSVITFDEHKTDVSRNPSGNFDTINQDQTIFQIKKEVEPTSLVDKENKMEQLPMQDDHIDKNKEAAAILLADLSIRQIQDDAQVQKKSHSIDETIIQVVNSCAKYQDDEKMDVSADESEPKFKKFKKTIDIKTKKRKSCESNEPTSDINLKSPKQKINPGVKRRKHINEMDLNTNVQATTSLLIGATTLPTLAATKSTSSNNPDSTSTMDIFGNRLNANACLPTAATSDLYMDDVSKQPIVYHHHQQHTSPKVSQINTILNKKSPLVCPPTPVLAKYTILDENNDATE